MLVNYLKRWHYGIDASGLTHYARNDRAACNPEVRTITRLYNEELLCPFCFGHIDMQALPSGMRVTHPTLGSGRVGRSDEVYSEVYTSYDKYFVAPNWSLTGDEK